ncbi:MAG: hypothetical protein EHM24_17640, partial [Acidobacteria bacterium]
MPAETLSRDPASQKTGGGFKGPMRPPRHVRIWLAVMAALFLAAHLPWLGDTLADIDAFNFALGAREFAPAKHQPHPPGSPVYVYLARASTEVLDAFRPEPSGTPVAPQRNAAEGLAFWSALGGALALFFLPYLFLRLAREDTRFADVDSTRVALAATALTVACPLFWFTAGRPLSDVPGLAAALGAQALTLAAFERTRQPGRGGFSLALAAFVAALIVGIRSQTMWLTMPLLLAVVATRWRTIARRDLALTTAAFAAGALAWVLPLLAATGGLGAYLAALGNQGAEDFTGVDMLYRNPTPSRLALGLLHTFVWPWMSVPLAVVVLVLAGVGAVRSLWRLPRALLMGLVAFLPYALFHIAFHETVTTRYALPLVPAVAWLAAIGASAIAGRLALPLLLALSVSAVALVVPASLDYHKGDSPAARLVTRLVDEAHTRGETPLVLAMHQRVHLDTRRVFDWMLEGREPRWRRLASTPRDEVWNVLRYWEEGGAAPVWFLASPARTDLALIDHASVREMGRFSWPYKIRTLAGNTRPNDVIWYELRDPGWYLEEGWALTPEIAGRSASRGRGPSVGGIEARVRRRGGPATLIIGGRNLGQPGEPAAHLEVSFDGGALLTADVAPGFFTRTLSLPAGALAGGAGFGTLRVAASGGPTVAIEQFDVQDAGRVVFAFGPGWHEPEYSPVEQRLWRWTSDRAELLVHHAGQDVEVEISGDAGGWFFQRARTITLRAGD